MFIGSVLAWEVANISVVTEYHLTAMESFMRDSKYSFTTTTEMFENKANLLESILDSFFKIKREIIISWRITA